MSMDILNYYYSAELFFIQPTPDSVDTPEAGIIDQELVDTMGDYMMEEM